MSIVPDVDRILSFGRISSTLLNFARKIPIAARMPPARLRSVLRSGWSGGATYGSPGAGELGGEEYSTYKLSQREIQTSTGPARVLVQEALDARGALVLGHGAGGSVSAPDLQVA